jgi:hypothetical protein
MRAHADWPVNILAGGQVIHGETVDFGLDGVHVCCDEPLPMDVDLRIWLAPPQEKSVELKGRVVWTDLSGIDGENKMVGMGICFVEVSGEDRMSLERILTTFLTEDS